METALKMTDNKLCMYTPTITDYSSIYRSFYILKFENYSSS